MRKLRKGELRCEGCGKIVTERRKYPHQSTAECAIARVEVLMYERNMRAIDRHTEDLLADVGIYAERWHGHEWVSGDIAQHMARARTGFVERYANPLFDKHPEGWRLVQWELGDPMSSGGRGFLIFAPKEPAERAAHVLRIFSGWYLRTRTLVQDAMRVMLAEPELNEFLHGVEALDDGYFRAARAVLLKRVGWSDSKIERVLR